MADEITRQRLQSDVAAILRRVEAGEAFVITTDGVPTAELRPISQRRYASREQIRAAFTGAPPIDSVQLRRDLERPGDRVRPTEP